MSSSRNKQADCKSGYQDSRADRRREFGLQSVLCRYCAALRMRWNLSGAAAFTAVLVACLRLCLCSGSWCELCCVCCACGCRRLRLLLRLRLCPVVGRSCACCCFAAVPLVPAAAVFTATFAVSAAAAFVAVPVVSGRRYVYCCDCVCG